MVNTKLITYNLNKTKDYYQSVTYCHENNIRLDVVPKILKDEHGVQRIQSYEICAILTEEQLLLMLLST